MDTRFQTLPYRLMRHLCIIQARLGSTRLPNKVMQTVGGIPMVKRVWLAAKGCHLINKVIVAWPERYPELDQNNVLERFRRIAKEYPSDSIIRLTADCPLLTSQDIYTAIEQFLTIAQKQGRFTSLYHSNHYDGHDVQIFSPDLLFNETSTHKEHVIADFATKSTGLSVNTPEDLERVRKLCATK